MLQPNVTLANPNPNDPAAIIAHQKAILNTHAPLFDLVSSGLQGSIPKATNTFKLYGGPIDLGVHAGNTRYLTKLFLGNENISVEDEEPLAEYELQHVANCGLCLQWKTTEVRILKATPTGIPKATSKARLEFYSSNQMNLGFEAGAVGEKAALTQLSLVLLWTLDHSYQYAGLQIACPRKPRRDRSVDCFWIADWQITGPSVAREAPVQQDADLHEIRPVHSPKTAVK